jgi:hypothetical protein
MAASLLCNSTLQELLSRQEKLATQPGSVFHPNYWLWERTRRYGNYMFAELALQVNQ